MSVQLDAQHLSNFIDENEFAAIAPQVRTAHETLHAGTGLGSDFLGWVDLPENYDKEEFSRIQAAAKKIRSDSQVFIVIGIGGSYLGARAAIEFLKSQNYNALKKDTPDIYFVGNGISSTALAEVLEICEGKDVSINVISKSGTTTEPAVAFRVFRSFLEKKYGKAGAAKRIYCTTDKSRGTLKAACDARRLRNVCRPRRRGRTLFRSHGRRPAADRRFRRGHRRSDEGRRRGEKRI